MRFLNRLAKKQILIYSSSAFLLILLFSFFTINYINAPKCVYGNCKTGFGSLEFKTGAVYSGNFKDARFEGYGILKLPTGEHYEGFWQNDLRHGKGKFFYADGSVYDGEFRNHNKNGKGSFTWSDQTNLKVTFLNGEPEGEGTLTLPNQVKLKGIYHKGLVAEGQGIYIYDDGSRYIGGWHNGKREGVGTLINKKGIVIAAGQWKNNAPEILKKR
ncbi:hypothetical protein LPTSP3_g07500 [Leptospira kobayashii]|uniref:MORN repeat protein n=1 Tax=Leptospira kobayashii TaxID=1917830 RepID=A0ABN6KDC5_9LEPT|nr:membrane-binding protein [Leptospira kobayashii]BDA77820.1 hypothetical protein LPTSP3_g07500 [Leptospira kobayashii]